jgi:glycosyltransferase 2 family protein
METISSPPPKSSLKKLVELSLKLVITIACFWYISTKINFSDAWAALLKAKWWLLFIAVLFYFISKIISGFRLNINFRNIKLYLQEWDNMKLYWLGMFYNLFLPGAISGDAYKVIILNKTFKAPLKKTSIAVLLDRVSGLLGLGVLLSVYGLIVLDNYLFYILLVTGCLISILIFYLIIRSFFKDFLPGFLSTFLLGLLVQALQVVCVYFIMWSLGISFHNSEWIFIFLVSSAISVLPISLGGGLGTRELVFAEGARFFNMKPELGIIISLLFYLNNLLSSAGGAYFIFHSPVKKNNSVLQSN